MVISMAAHAFLSDGEPSQYVKLMVAPSSAFKLALEVAADAEPLAEPAAFCSPEQPETERPRATIVRMDTTLRILIFNVLPPFYVNAVQV